MIRIWNRKQRLPYWLRAPAQACGPDAYHSPSGPPFDLRFNVNRDGAARLLLGVGGSPQAPQRPCAISHSNPAKYSCVASRYLRLTAAAPKASTVLSFSMPGEAIPGPHLLRLRLGIARSSWIPLEVADPALLPVREALAQRLLSFLAESREAADTLRLIAPYQPLPVGSVVRDDLNEIVSHHPARSVAVPRLRPTALWRIRQCPVVPGGPAERRDRRHRTG